MVVTALFFLSLISGIVSSEASKLNAVKTKSSIMHYLSLKRTGIPNERLNDQCLKQGSFKIDDDNVIGGGIYEIKDTGIEINLKIKITSSEKPTPTKPAPAGATKPAPAGATKPAPGGATKPAPEGATTPAPGGATKPAAGGATTAPGGATTAAPGGATTAAPSSQGSDAEQEALNLHNKFRKIHDAPAMKLNAEMSQSAQSYATKLANQGSLKHSQRGERDNAGENLSYGCSSSKGQTTEEAVTNWYNEVCDPGYTFGSGSMGGAGHFTQVVWKESVELGFGKADSESGGMKCTYYVGRYKIAGNMGGEFPKNVVKGSFDRSYCSTIKKN